MKQQKVRRQVSFNIDDNLYTEFKKLMLEERTTPTADITRYIQKRVNVEEINNSAEIEEEKINTILTNDKVEKTDEFTILTNDLKTHEKEMNFDETMQLYIEIGKLLKISVLTEDDIKKLKNIREQIEEIVRKY
ncbi:hypothetical protein [Clostridium butyricum]|uniref:hypothetical protein n=1 Tax=Clostridium butyricum TaxID=1492 RepID=UPI00016B9A6D|nr:hypothetical protein [Clostridium butyricum]EDT73699.1 hypothetical protein CBY_2305 [Clostridium butyricum 5521]NFL31130.1 hypothetical protein [Clostridium butyricum]